MGSDPLDFELLDEGSEAGEFSDRIGFHAFHEIPRNSVQEFLLFGGDVAWRRLAGGGFVLGEKTVSHGETEVTGVVEPAFQKVAVAVEVDVALGCADGEL